jgi:hypothetical protein
VINSRPWNKVYTILLNFMEQSVPVSGSTNLRDMFDLLYQGAVVFFSVFQDSPQQRAVRLKSTNGNAAPCGV